MSAWNKGHCSWFFDRFAGADIGLHCYDHDAAYDAGGVLLKLKADYELGVGIMGEARRVDGLHNKALLVVAGVCAWALTSTVGWGFWLKTRYDVEWK